MENVMQKTDFVSALTEEISDLKLKLTEVTSMDDYLKIKKEIEALQERILEDKIATNTLVEERPGQWIIKLDY